MQIIYKYDDQEFFSEREVRQAIFNREKKAFSEAPSTGKEKFWEGHGVQLLEIEEPIEVKKQLKLSEIKQSFKMWRGHLATLTSSLGFEVDSDDKALNDVNGLIISASQTERIVRFRDANNYFHTLSIEQLKTLQYEIATNINYAYEQKWAMESMVQSANDDAELSTIDIVFIGKVFK